MIVLGPDTHKRSHTIAAVSAAMGELMREQTVQVGAKGFAALVVWARALGTERVWALEDCRHVSGSFERFLIERGERVVRATTQLMADSRRRARGGTSDSIDAIALARAALRESLDALPAAQLEGPNSICGCSWIIASGWSASAWRSTTRCNGICTTSGPNCDCQAARCSVLRQLGPARRSAARAR
jgi:hypothetical protein